MTDREYLVLVYSFTPFGPMRTKLLLSYFETARKIWEADTKVLAKVGLKGELIEKFETYRHNLDKKDYFNRLKNNSINFVTIGDKNYPRALLGLDDAPIVLYVKGELSINNLDAVAIVGSRKMSAYGKEVAQKFASQLAQFGVVIVSGMARGVDTAAHEGSLAVGGKTIAVLACGLDIIYPPENHQLAKKITEKGAIISEFPVGYPPVKNNFATRNRIISGLSKAIIVVEGLKKSGTLLTASHAAEQGKTVFAVPGQITSPNSEAPHYLIKNGAKFAFSTEDIVEELGLQLKVDAEAMNAVLPSGKEEKELLEILEVEPLHINDIVRKSTLDTPVVVASLTGMELKGMVKNLGGGTYKKTS